MRKAKQPVEVEALDLGGLTEVETLDLGGLLAGAVDAHHNKQAEQEQAVADGWRGYVACLRRAAAGKATPDDVATLAGVMEMLNLTEDRARRDSEIVADALRLAPIAGKLAALEVKRAEEKAKLEARLLELKEQEDAARRAHVTITYEYEASSRAANRLEALRQQRPVLFE